MGIFESAKSTTSWRLPKVGKTAIGTGRRTGWLGLVVCIGWLEKLVDESLEQGQGLLEEGGLRNHRCRLLFQLKLQLALDLQGFLDTRMLDALLHKDTTNGSTRDVVHLCDVGDSLVFNGPEVSDIGFGFLGYATDWHGDSFGLGHSFLVLEDYVSHHPSFVVEVHESSVGRVQILGAEVVTVVSAND